MNLGIIILAAGSASRMGSPKQILDINGKSLLERVIALTDHIDAGVRTVVLGANKEVIKPEIAHLAVNIIENPNWQDGMSTSIKMGVVGTFMINKDVDKVLVLAGDMPGISVHHLNRLVAASLEVPEKTIFASSYDNTIGVPCVFEKEHFIDLIELDGDIGAAQVFIKYKDSLLPIKMTEGSMDLDTPEDYFNYLESTK